MMPIPSIVDETDAYALVYKPPLMHSVPLRPEEGDTLLDWYAARFPAVRMVRGRQAREGGALHRLDYETSGLVLFARTQAAMDALSVQQEEGRFIKEYEALSAGSFAGLSAAASLPGFPSLPGEVLSFFRDWPGAASAVSEDAPLLIESAFRAYGPGRRAVRPVTGPGHKKGAALDRGRPYSTEIVHMQAAEAPFAGAFRPETHITFRIRITRGFRHQIRCHLAWLGFPILNDTLYGGRACADTSGTSCLALRAHGISFFDPESGEARSYRLQP